MWGGSDETLAITTLHRALDAGINFWDTAPVYGFGRAEEIMGRALWEGNHRDKVVLATKAGLDWRGSDGIKRNASKERILQEIDDSLRRLGTDRIDLLQVHWPDDTTPAQETAEALTEAKQAGKILAIGVSNYSPQQMEEFRKYAPLATNQPPYNLFEREIERDVLPYCRQHDIGVVSYGALCRGLLGGQISMATHFDGDDLRQFDPKFHKPRLQEYLRAVHRLDEIAHGHGRRVLHLAIRWLLDQPGVSICLWGARKPEQLDSVQEALGWHIDDTMRQEIEQALHLVSQPLSPEWMAPAAH